MTIVELKLIEISLFATPFLKIKTESGRLEFEEFLQLAIKFIVEEDDEAMAKELREAFRLYDKEGNGFIPTSCLKEILRELDDQLTDDDLNNMIDEVSIGDTF